ncbi:uncharacterized protein LOC119685103 [Teleopsis dalmanni]|uniref:uncharacterized protein LOC119685103 n=1 Tax=Teleopsis dalmanni TaxID=139649 RepID=UPI0018CF2E67|nr:uncharacterized protein LOC119685103 [Teleopsis dalmanni]
MTRAAICRRRARPKKRRRINRPRRIYGRPKLSKSRNINKNMIDRAIMTLTKKKAKISRNAIKKFVMKEYERVTLGRHSMYMLNFYMGELVKFGVIRSCSKFCFEMIEQPELN